MRRAFGWCWMAVLAMAGSAGANGMLVPTDQQVPPLAIVYQRVNVTIDNQVATTTVEQVFHNNTSRDLEAFYLFPLPAGASVREFAMWVGGKRVSGEMVEAAKARQTYEDIVRRMRDPGLLEYMDNNLWRVRVYPVPKQDDQKLEISYSEVLPRDGDLSEYVYPLKTGERASTTLRDFTLTVKLQSAQALQAIYSPTHHVGIDRKGDHAAVVSFEKGQYTLDKDFRLIYAVSPKAVGLTFLTHRDKGQDGYFMLLATPRTELKADAVVPRDIVFVLDTSGSMSDDGKIEQARKALVYSLSHLGPKDRFGLIHFATVVDPYDTKLHDATPAAVADAKKWVEGLQANGGTNIDEALTTALAMRRDAGRNFTVVFLTDGMPTVGVTDPQQILKDVEAKNTANTRIFVFGVGNDVNTHLLDQLAERTKSVSQYVKPGEDIEVKVSTLWNKISHPVLANLELAVADPVHLSELYPPQLPDLFHGSQLIVLGRYRGAGHVAVHLKGKLGDQTQDYVYEATFPEATEEHGFIEPLWARRKVGYLLDQIRLHGETAELKTEVIHLARQYGIATPYTSFLIIPEGVKQGQVAFQAVPQGGPSQDQGVVAPGGRGAGVGRAAAPNGILGGAPAQSKGFEGRRAGRGPALQPSAGAAQSGGGGFGGGGIGVAGAPGPLTAVDRASSPAAPPLSEVHERVPAAEAARSLVQKRDALDDRESAVASKPQQTFQFRTETGAVAVSIAENLDALKRAKDAATSAVRTAGGHQFVQVDGVWVDRAYTEAAPTITVKALSAAYFQILKLHPEAKQVLALGQRLVWVTPSGTALIIDQTGREKLSDEQIHKLFQTTDRPSRGGGVARP